MKIPPYNEEELEIVFPIMITSQFAVVHTAPNN